MKFEFLNCEVTKNETGELVIDQKYIDQYKENNCSDKTNITDCTSVMEKIITEAIEFLQQVVKENPKQNRSFRLGKFIHITLREDEILSESGGSLGVKKKH